MKKGIVFLFTFFLAFLLLGKNAEAASPSIYIDGEKISVSTSVVNGNTLVPLRTIAEKLGLEVGWNQSTQMTTVSHPHRPITVYHKVGTKYVSVYEFGSQFGEANDLSVASVVQNGVTYVPIRFFENFDAHVNWDGTNNRIDVYSYELKMNQYLILTSLSYNNLNSYANNQTTLNNIIPYLSGGYKSDFKNVNDKLYIYTNYTANEFASNEMLMKEWVVKTILTRNDFATSTEYTNYLNSGFTGYAFRNIRTNEVVIAYRGTNFKSWADWEANKSSLIDKSNKQKPYALQLFRKSLSGADKVTIVGHSLGGNLAQGVAAYYPYNYDSMVTFNAFGSGIDAPGTEYDKATNYVISTDPVKAARTHYGGVISYKIRAYPDDEFLAAHSLFNFYSYYFKADSKYWSNGYGVPYESLR